MKVEFQNGTPVIERNIGILQRPTTKIYGYLCLFDITSLMRKHLTYQELLDNLTTWWVSKSQDPWEIVTSQGANGVYNASNLYY